MHSLNRRALVRLPAAVLLLGLLECTACAVTGRFIWVDEFRADESEATRYLIQSGDVLTVRVLNQDAISGRMKVRADGKISLPFLNDVDAAGYAPSALAQQLQTRLKDFINVPVVTVAVEERSGMQISVVGEVARPGNYPLESGAGLLPAIAASGGLTDFAHRDRIFVLRGAERATRIRFTWQALVQAEGRAATFRLSPGDVIVVE